MNGSELLEVLTRTGATIGRTADGQVVALGLPSALDSTLAEHATDIALAIAGARKVPWQAPAGPYGSPATLEQALALAFAVAAPRKVTNRTYRWRSCDTCREPVLAAKSARCRRAACPGKAVDIAYPPLELDGHELPCSRPGCANAATHRTAWHELVCSADFYHLALANVTSRRLAP